MKEPKLDAGVIAGEVRELLDNVKSQIPEDFEPYVMENLPAEGIGIYCEVAKCMGDAYEKAPSKREKNRIAHGFVLEAESLKKINKEFSEDEKIDAHSLIIEEGTKGPKSIRLPSEVYQCMVEAKGD